MGLTPQSYVRLSNTIGVFSVILLLFWVFAFIVIQVGDLKVFGKEITQTFYFSIVAILALMAAALILNIMMNLTRIAQNHDPDPLVASPRQNRRWIMKTVVAAFPILFLVLVGGDLLTSRQKESQLMAAAESIAEQYPKQQQHFSTYSFDRDWIQKTASYMEVLKEVEQAFNHVTLIVPEEIDGIKVQLGFTSYHSFKGHFVGPNEKDKEQELHKTDYIHRSSAEDRAYLNEVFMQDADKARFETDGDNYVLFLPVRVEGGQDYVLRFSNRSSYGKLGS